jgi:hypothetical protein
LIADDNPHNRFYALDILAVCAVADDADKYVHVVRLLEDPHDYIRAHVMFLMSNASASQLQVATRSFGAGGAPDALHTQGLSQLLADRPDAGQISSMVDSPEPLLRRYGAIAAWRYRDRMPELVSRLASSTDQDIKKFSEQQAGRQQAKT